MFTGIFNGNGDLAELHPLTVELHLGIFSAHIIITAIQTQADQIAAAIHLLTGEVNILHKGILCQFRSAYIACAEAFTGNIHFTASGGQHRTPVFIQHIGPGIGQRTADGDMFAPSQGFHRGKHGGFGGAVHIHQHAIGAIIELIDQRISHHFTAQQHDPDMLCGCTEGLVAKAHIQSCRCHFKHTGIIGFHQIGKLPGKHHFFLVRQHHRPAQSQRNQRFYHEAVENGIGGTQHISFNGLQQFLHLGI